MLREMEKSLLPINGRFVENHKTKQPENGPVSRQSSWKMHEWMEIVCLERCCRHFPTSNNSDIDQNRLHFQFSTQAHFFQFSVFHFLFSWNFISRFHDSHNLIKLCYAMAKTHSNSFVFPFPLYQIKRRRYSSLRSFKYKLSNIYKIRTENNSKDKNSIFSSRRKNFSKYREKKRRRKTLSWAEVWTTSRRHILDVLLYFHFGEFHPNRAENSCRVQ